MLRLREIQPKLNGLDRFLKECQNGCITKFKAGIIASKMGDECQGVFQHNKSDESLDLVDLMRLVLDRWYEMYLYKPNVDGDEELLKILKSEEVRLPALASEIEVHLNTLGRKGMNTKKNTNIIFRNKFLSVSLYLGPCFYEMVFLIVKY